jgi:uncharacterized membrane protein YeaQ/YmgE (transglycosylase-associated protein family)
MVMTTFLTWLAVGLLTGGLAALVLKAGGRGLASDMVLSLFGSSLATLITVASGLAPNAGPVATGFLAFVGAATVLVAQRTVWGHRL